MTTTQQHEQIFVNTISDFAQIVLDLTQQGYIVLPDLCWKKIGYCIAFQKPDITTTTKTKEQK